MLQITITRGDQVETVTFKTTAAGQTACQKFLEDLIKDTQKTPAFYLIDEIRKAKALEARGKGPWRKYVYRVAALEKQRADYLAANNISPTPLKVEIVNHD